MSPASTGGWRSRVVARSAALSLAWRSWSRLLAGRLGGFDQWIFVSYFCSLC
ncbi:RING [Musa troglodytarum]|uniref:RING n=1 Tax=Musa troglodytarum TaxID=320322 RepID=A0A9E7JJ37_9LILI|nr:RING [Musa troglodytarum]